MTVKEKANIPKEDEVIIMVGEQRVYSEDTHLGDLYDECAGNDGFLYCQFLLKDTLH